MSTTSQCKANVLRRLALLCLIASAGCSGDSTTPGTGAAAGSSAGAAGAAAGSGSNGPSITFTAVYAMMFPMATNARCNACHANPANDITNGNLFMGMDQDTAYKALVGKVSTGSLCMPRELVVPGKPDMSLILQKLLPTPPCGVRMPNGGKQFTEAQLDMVRSWIAGGAKND